MYVHITYDKCMLSLIYLHYSILDHVSCSTWLREDLTSDQTPSKQALENEEKLIGTFKVKTDNTYIIHCIKLWT